MRWSSLVTINIKKKLTCPAPYRLLSLKVWSWPWTTSFSPVTRTTNIASRAGALSKFRTVVIFKLGCNTLCKGPDRGSTSISLLSIPLVSHTIWPFWWSTCVLRVQIHNWNKLFEAFAIVWSADIWTHGRASQETSSPFLTGTLEPQHLRMGHKLVNYHGLCTLSL